MKLYHPDSCLQSLLISKKLACTEFNLRFQTRTHRSDHIHHTVLDSPSLFACYVCIRMGILCDDGIFEIFERSRMSVLPTFSVAFYQSISSNSPLPVPMSSTIFLKHIGKASARSVFPSTEQSFSQMTLAVSGASFDQENCVSWGFRELY